MRTTTGLYALPEDYARQRQTVAQKERALSNLGRRKRIVRLTGLCLIVLVGAWIWGWL